MFELLPSPLVQLAPIAAAVAVMLGGQHLAHACKIESPKLHQVVSLARDDVAPPSKAMVRIVEIVRGSGTDLSDACGSVASVTIAVEATDNRTPRRHLGWLIEVVDGRPLGPLPTVPIRAEGGRLSINWFEEAGVDTKPLEVTLRMTAVDLAGNHGPSSEPITIRDAGYARRDAGEQDRTTAESRCVDGDADSCLWAGKMFSHGFRGGRDAARGRELYVRACDLGEAYACELVGSESRAAKIYAGHCSARSGDACLALGRLFFEGRGVRADAKRAEEYYAMACDLGNAASCFLLAEPDYDHLCSANDADACMVVGLRLRRGADKSPEKAVPVLTRSCELGNQEACRAVAGMALVGWGTPRDLARAAANYERACELGDEEATCTAHEVLGSWSRGEPDALARLIKLCESDIGDAVCSFIGQIYDEGLGMVAKDWDEARSFFQKACHKGAVESCLLLGKRFFDGIGQQKDELAAATVFNKGCLLADLESCTRTGIACDRLRVAPGRDAEYRSICSPSGGSNPHVGGAELAAAYGAACDAGHPDMCFRGGSLERNPAISLWLNWRACNGGVVDACQVSQRSCAVPSPARWLERLRTAGLLLGAGLLSLGIGLFLWWRVRPRKLR